MTQKHPGAYYDAKEHLKNQRKNNPKVFWTWAVLRFFVLQAMVISILRGQYENTFTCVLVLLLFLSPSLVEKRFRIRLPDGLQIAILVFIFAAEILGELACYYVRYSHWDTLLHTTWGFLCAAFGYSLVDLLNDNPEGSIRLSPLYMALAAFCFSMTIGVLWEFFEFSMDRLLFLDMQKDTIITTISSVALDPTNSNTPVVIRNIGETVVNGTILTKSGYLDIGLYDTMEDLFVNFIGALVFSVIGYFRGKRKLADKITESLVPTRIK